MSSVPQKIAELARARRDIYVQRSMELVTSDPDTGQPTYSQRDMEQMIDGFLSLLAEACQGESREVRTFFLETVIPGLMAAGASASGIAGGVVEIAILVSTDVVMILDAGDRAEAQGWLARFYNGYIADLVRVAEEASK